MKKVTIMIPTYNQSEYIEQAINSALGQSYKNLEVIISDDSTDNQTEKVIKEKYLSDSRIKYFHNIPSLGRVGNYHKVLYDRATGDYVLNLDGDDWLIDMNYISQAVKILDENLDVNCVIANQKIYIEDKNIYIEVKNNTSKIAIFDGHNYLCKIMQSEKITFSHLTTLYRKKLAKNMDFYTKNMTFTDAQSLFKLIINSKVAFINKNIGVWRRHFKNETFGVSNIKSFDQLFEHFIDLKEHTSIKNIAKLDKCNWFFKMKLHYLKLYLYEIQNLYGYIELLKKLKYLYIYDKKLFISILKWLISTKLPKIKKDKGISDV